MRIAFVSYEYPPDAAYGGIGTYVDHASRMLAARGHQVEVFSSSPHRAGTFEQGAVRVHRIVETDYLRFGERIGPVFAERHARVRFDVLEGPDYGADARDAFARTGDVALVVKLHTPTFLTMQAAYQGLPMTSPQRLHMLGARLRGYVRRRRRGLPGMWRYTLVYDAVEESEHAGQADVVSAPSRAIAEIVGRAWSLDPAKLEHLPYPFLPDASLVALPAAVAAANRHDVLFLGRLEIRKGVLDLARAIPRVLARFPTAHFRLVGGSAASPRAGVDMRRYLVEKLAPWSDRVELVGQLSPADVARELARAAVCVLPSVWDNFPYACLEAMAAARAIVATGSGGMAEMLCNGESGRVVRPGDARALAAAIVDLLGDRALAARLGTRARARVLDGYGAERIGPLQEQQYARAIERARGRRQRPAVGGSAQMVDRLVR